MLLKIAWVTRSFLDYRIPVFEALDLMVDGNLFLIYSGDYVPQSVQDKVKQILGRRAIDMHGEWKIGKEDQYFMSNRNISIRFQPRLIKQIRTIKPDILVCDGFFKWTFPALFYRIFYRVPIVINYERTFHTERNVQWFRTLYRKLVVRITDGMDCNGKLCVDYTKSLGMPVAKITTGHMSADTKALSLKAQEISKSSVNHLRKKWEVQGVVITYIGRLHHRKGCIELLEAWAELEKHYSQKGTLFLIGDGEQADELENFCTAQQLKHVRFVGTVPYDEIPAYYAASDVFIIPTLEDNWSMVVPEAMACGLPILCSKYNGCWPELVHEDKNGWVFDPLDKADILRVMEVCLSRQNELQEMGKISQKIIKGYGPDNAAKSIMDACNIAFSKKKTT